MLSGVFESFCVNKDNFAFMSDICDSDICLSNVNPVSGIQDDWAKIIEDESVLRGTGSH